MPGTFASGECDDAAVVVGKYHYGAPFQSRVEDALARDVEVVAVHQAVHRAVGLKVVNYARHHAPHAQLLVVEGPHGRVGGVGLFELRPPQRAVGAVALDGVFSVDRGDDDPPVHWPQGVVDDQ